MKIVVFAHPSFIESTSMPLFAEFLVSGLASRGHEVEMWAPLPLFHKLPAPKRLKKWLGYIDQFVVFPIQVFLRVRSLERETLFVFSDQALGPWVPLVSKRPNVIHCHDFLALRSSLGEFAKNPVSLSGRLYQRWIRAGFRRGASYICVSERTKEDLLRSLGEGNAAARVVHNAFNYPYQRVDSRDARTRLDAAGYISEERGFILHVGGNQWYKNRFGVLAIYEAYARRVKNPLPLLMIGAEPTKQLRDFAESFCGSDSAISFLVRPSAAVLEAAYSSAAALVFPSLAEGFGWPIVEAMACGCPVLTTGDSPMNEIGGDVASYLPPMPERDLDFWADECATLLDEVLSRDEVGRRRIREAGLSWARRFERDRVLAAYESIYLQSLPGGPA